MAFWIAVAILTAAVTYVLIRPLAKASTTPAVRALPDVAVYKDQLAEIDRDVTAGEISADEASSARAEVSRRLLRQSGRTQDRKEAKNVSRPPLTALYYAASIALPLASAGLYLLYGNPALPGLPYAQRVASAVDRSNTNDLIAKVETRLREHPEDGQGWDVIAPVYMAQGRFDDAANAYQTAARILGQTPQRLEGFATARIRAGNGIVGEDAKSALKAAQTLDPKRLEPRIWLALGKEQEGDKAGAVADYKALLDSDAPSTAPWRRAVAGRLAALQGGAPETAGGTEKQSEGAAPARPDANAVAAMSPDDRQKMIVGMVEGLAQRLKSNGNDLTGWLKLIRAYKVLGRDQDAVAALGEARKNFSADGNALAEIDALAKSLGIGS